MKRTFYILYFILQVVACLAQSQSGKVKTLGRPTQKGVPLPGVTVRVMDSHNAIVSGKNGEFSFSTNKKEGESFAIRQVQKVGYELNDRDVIGRKYAFSSTHPITIVMVSTKQLQSEKTRIENNAYAVAEKNYNKKLATLEAQLKNGKIDTDKYNDQIKSLQSNFEKFQSLIDELSEHYAHIDYDDMDNNEREIAQYIENGDFDKADSLIHQCFDATDVLARNIKALDKIEQGINQAKDVIADANRSMAEVLRRQAKDAEYLYQLYTITLAQFDNEKAGQYILTRAELDTTNVNWTVEAAKFLADYRSDYDEALRYYDRAERYASKIPAWLSAIYTNKGDIYLEQGKYVEAIKADSIALSISTRLYGNHGLNTLKAINNMALALKQLGEPRQALLFWNEVYNIAINDKDMDIGFIATLCNNISTTCADLGHYSLALEFGNKAIEAYKVKGSALGEALAYGNLGGFYGNMGQYQEALDYYDRSEKLYKKLLGDDNPNLGWVLVKKGNLYSGFGDTNKAYKYNKRSFEIYKRFYDSKSIVLANALVNFAGVNPNKSEAKAQIDSALTIIIGKYGERQLSVANAYYEKALICTDMEQYMESEKLLQRALLIYNTIIGTQYNSYSAQCYASLSDVVLGMNNMGKAVEYMNQAVEISDSINGDRINMLKLTALYQKAALLLQQQNMVDCKALCLQVIDDCKHVADLYADKISDFYYILSAITMRETKTKDMIVGKFSEALGYALKAYNYKLKVKGLDDDSLESSIYNIMSISGVLKQLGNTIPSEITDVIKNNPQQTQKALSRMKP